MQVLMLSLWISSSTIGTSVISTVSYQLCNIFQTSFVNLVYTIWYVNRWAFVKRTNKQTNNNAIADATALPSWGPMWSIVSRLGVPSIKKDMELLEWVQSMAWKDLLYCNESILVSLLTRIYLMKYSRPPCNCKTNKTHKTTLLILHPSFPFGEEPVSSHNWL